GRYLNQRFGTQLLNINVELAGDGDALRLTRFEGTDANSGRISAEGRVDLKNKPAPALDLRARLQQFQLAASDAMRATSNAEIRVGGTVAAPSLFARIQIPRAQFLIPDRLPPSVVNLEVEEIDSRKPAGSQARAEAPKKSPPLVVQLDVQLDVPGQTFVRGRGLDSEWRGSINVTGTSAAPVLRADIEAVQGTVQLLGTSFTLQRGEISFPSGLSADPYLDILAQHRAADIVAQVLLQGSPLSPRLTLTSQPELPQDQVLSRVLFGKSPGSITAAQGVQLAYAVRTLTTGGPGLIDRLRESTGLDRLDLGGSDPAGGPTVSGGKYIADGVFVGVEQGAKANSTRATVEIEVLPSVTARSAVGGSSSLVGVDWQYDY
ncbi:MAG: translocation/assembly module TamB domain-containing protein, partial [Ferrovibrionaceae bacterium]